MKTYIKYSDLSKAERRSLATVAYRSSGTLRTIRYASVFVPIIVCGTLARQLAGDNGVGRLVITVGAALVLCLAIWESVGRPRLKAEVERLKNAEPGQPTGFD